MKTSIVYSPNAPKVYHHPSKDRLFVKRVTGLEVLKNQPHSELIGGIEGDLLISNDIYYAACRVTGVVDWTKTEILRAHDLVGRDNVYIINMN